MKLRKPHRWIRRIALGLAVAAIAAPSALADIPEGWDNAYFGPANLVRVPQVTIPEGWDNAYFGPANIVGPATAEVAVEPDGFNYRDAGIGIAVGLGAALLGVATVLMARRHRPLAG